MSKEIWNDNWEDQQKEAEKAASGGLFLKLKDDGDSVSVAFVQAPVLIQRPSFKDKAVMTNKMIANVAVFDGGEYTEMSLLELAPKHWEGLMKRRVKFGGAKLYTIERRGKAGDTQVIYDCDSVRDLTDVEKAMLLKVEYHDIKGVGADSEIDYLADFRTACSTEWKRLGWNKEDKARSISKYFGKHINAEDMSGDQRINFMTALKYLKDGATPDNLSDTIDLDEDTDFF